MRRLYALILFVCFSSVALAAETKVSLDLDVREIKIGEPIKMHLEIRFPIGNEIKFPSFGDTITKSITIIDRQLVDTTYDEEDFQTKIIYQDFVITSFDSGIHVIPPIQFMTQDGPIETEAQLITAHSVEVEMQATPDPTGSAQPEIKDIKPIYEVSFSFIDWVFQNWKWLLITYLLCGIALALYVYRDKFKRKPKEEEEIVPDVPAHILAFEKLVLLEDKKLWQNGQVKVYYSELSEIFREYLENRYDITALEETTDEILSEVRQLSLPKSALEEMHTFLSESDMVKFAKAQPTPSENESFINWVKQFVEQTKIEEEEDIPEDSSVEEEENDLDKKDV